MDYAPIATPVTPDWVRVARWALAEDQAAQDVTTALLGPAADRRVTASFQAEERFVVAGLPLARAVFAELDPEMRFQEQAPEGAEVTSGESIAAVTARARAILGGERVALNFLQRLSGVATITRRAVEGTAGTPAVVTDTRKTTPGLRDLEKYAVRIGGGVNHRRSLADAVLWKDNHWALLRASGGRLADTLRDLPPQTPMQVEVENEEQLIEALEAGVKSLLVDNQPPGVIAKWLKRVGTGVTIEASGGITPDHVADYARCGVHRISIGALTHSAPAVAIKLEIEID